MASPAFSHNGQYWEVSKDGNPRPFSPELEVCCCERDFRRKYFVSLEKGGEEGFWPSGKNRLLPPSGNPCSWQPIRCPWGAAFRIGPGIRSFLSGEQPQGRANTIRCVIQAVPSLFSAGQPPKYLSFSRDEQWSPMRPTPKENCGARGSTVRQS